MPKNAPCGRPATKRAAISVPYVGAKTLTRLPSVKTTIRPSSSVLRSTRAVSDAMSGAPTTTPSAYAEMTCPAVGSVMPRLEAMSGSRPIATNSVVPMPNPPSASAKTASQRTDGAGETTDCARVGRSRVRVTGSTVGLLMPVCKMTFVFVRRKWRSLRFACSIDHMTSVGDVFALIRELRDTTRAELAQLTGLSRTAVAARVGALVEIGLVAESERAPVDRRHARPPC